MLHSKYIWQTHSTDAEALQRLKNELSISPLLSSLLVNRGITTPQQAQLFLGMERTMLHDPYLLKGMKEAVPRIERAVSEGEHILIYGDYDADGVSSTTLMIYLMRYMNASYDIYIPHRSNEGYGLHNHALDWAHQQGVSLIITVDTGISAVSQIQYANELGMDVIVTDHHEPPEELPNAYALINPKQLDCPYPFKGLAGVGVAYKLAQALLGEPPQEWTEIVAIGTIADLMPLVDENRILVQQGIQSMRNSMFPGVRELLEVSGVAREKVTSIHIAFGMAPRINASGRLDHAGRAVALLTSTDMEEAQRIAHELDELNKERQQVVHNIVEEATAMLEKRIQNDKLPSVIVIAGEGWNVGVVGIVASKLLERYYRPVIILGIDPETGMCKGSARSIPGVDIYEALTSCKDVMDHYGGHPAAAGMSLHRDQLQAFEQGLIQFADAVLTPEMLTAVTQAEGEWALSDLSLSVIEEMEKLAPFGMNNAVPKIIIRNLEIVDVQQMGREKNHLKLVLQQGRDKIEAVAFGQGMMAELITTGSRIDVIGELTINEWNGSRKLQMMLHDWSIPEPQVFDCRGCSDPVKELNRHMKLLETRLSANEQQCIAILKKDAEKTFGSDFNHLNDLPHWVYDKKAGIIASNAYAAQSGKSDITTLYVLDVPEHAFQLEDLFTSFSSLNNIVLLHAKKQQERILFPDREQFKRLYVTLTRMGDRPLKETDAIARLSQQFSISSRMLKMMMDVFEELSFIGRQEGHITVVQKPAKQQLESSRQFRELSDLAEMEQYLLDAGTTQVTNWMISRLKGAS